MHICNFCCTFAAAKVLNEKRNMRKTILLVALVWMVNLAAQNKNEAYLAYIDQWKETALQNQEDYGIPASIIMAQALLESAAGTSELAVNANNHFGIKCNNDWMGGVYYYDDDSKGECFRQYGDAAMSFKDHALFLQRPRYATCFEIAIEDYEGWAYRLKECGYATDKNYAPKLIKIIETYRLDSLEIQNSYPEGTINSKFKIQNSNPEDTVILEEVKPVEKKRPLKATVVHASEPIMVIHNDPEPEYVAPKTARQERDSFLLEHPKKKINGVNYVVAREGDTYANVAFRLNVRERELRENNDALGRELAVGDKIYLAPKKTTGAEEYVWTRPGLSFWRLCQDEGVQMEAIRKLNELDPAVRVFRTRQKIYLQKIKEQKPLR